MTKRYIYMATVLNVVDGDTVDIEVDLGFRVYQEMRVRLAGIDTPEKNASDVEVRAEAMKAKQRAMELVLGKRLLVETFKVDKYGRYLAKVFLDTSDGTSLNDVLLSEGLAVAYDGGKR
jgi:micrococcal nuclease